MLEVAPPAVALKGKRSRAARLRRASRSQQHRNQASGQVAHSSLDEFFRSRLGGNFFGDDSQSHPAHSTRVCFQNVHGISSAFTDEKQKGLFQSWRGEKVGISLLAEMNLNWKLVKPGHKWSDRVRKVAPRGHYSSVSFDDTQKIPSPSAFQWGGCAATLLNEVSHSAQASGSDPSGLGRWAWIKLRGRVVKGTSEDVQSEAATIQPRDLVVISAYRPNKASPNPMSVWARQREFWLSKGVETDPREKFTSDLRDEISKWRKAGSEVILGLDANEDLSTLHPSSLRYKMREVGMTEAILSRHHGPYPATQQSNSRNCPIDGLFVSAGVHVLAGGYLDFEQYFQSDHRGIWIDIDLWKTLGRPRPKKVFPVRRLNNRDKRAVGRYIRAAEDGYDRYDIARRLKSLGDELGAQQGQLSPAQARQYNCLHAQAYAVRRKAERHCRHVRRGGVQWSPRMQKKWDRIRLLQLLLKGYQGVRTSSRRIRCLLRKTRMKEAWRFTEVELEEKLAEERKVYNDAKRRLARRWRKRHVEAKSKAPWKATKRAARRRQAMSRQKRMALREETRRRRKAQGKGFSGGLVRIRVPPTGDSESDWTTCTTRRRVEDGCMRENQVRYDQTRFPHPTPPMEEPLYSMFNGPEAESNSRALLQGTLSPPADDPLLASFFNQCRRPSHLADQPLHVTVEDHVSFWSRMQESKGSEPHGLHNGHLKAGATSSKLAMCDTVFRAIPFAHSFVPEQWKNLMNFAIEKKPGEIRVTKMRTIQMMNSEFQANNKKVGKAAMAYAEEHGLIPEGQCGARKAHQAIDLALAKRLTWDLLFLQRRAAGHISNDAKSCFDRIVHWVAIISLMRFGIAWQTLRSMFDTLMQSTHRVRTGFGDSRRAFTPPSRFPFQGCGQGNGASPTIWVAVSAILMGMMISQGFGFEFLSALSGLAVIANCFAFIDDTDISVAAVSVDQDGESVFPQVRSSLHWWSSALRLSGGALSPSKSFWWLIDFKWDPIGGNWLFRRKSDFGGDGSLRLVTPDLDGTPVDLKWLEPDQVERTLGVMMSPQHDPKEQFQTLKEKAALWAATVHTGRLLPYDVLPVLKSTILKSVEYPMALTTFSAAEWESILSPVLLTLLPKAVICRRFPRAVVYAPLRFQGLGVPHPMAVQAYKHLDMLLRHPANRTSTALYLLAALEAHQLELGSQYGLFQQVYEDVSVLVTDTWLRRVWQLLQELGIHVEVDLPALELRRQGDGLLMDLFLDAPGMDLVTLKWLNWCRVFLHVITVSDIVTADGSKVREAIWNGQRDEHQLPRFNWPRSSRPSSTRWESWRRWLGLVLECSDRKLRVPLGPWFVEDPHWRWRFSPSTRRLFHLEGGGWVEAYAVSRSKGRNFQFRSVSVGNGVFVQSVPEDTTLATVSRTSRQSVITVLSVGTVLPPPPPVESLVQWVVDLRQRCSPGYGWVPEHFQIEGAVEPLLVALREGQLRVVCDGSFKDGLGTACAQLRTETGPDVIWIWCRTTGAISDQSSTRSELMGILASLIFIDGMSTLASLRRFSGNLPLVELGCDGFVALQKCFGTGKVSPSSPSFDLVSTIRAVTLRLPIALAGRHVRGHADRHRPWSQLDWWERRNCEVDQRAQAFRELLASQEVQQASNPRFFDEPASVFLDGVKQSRLTSTSIANRVARQRLFEYWERRVKEGKRPRLTPSQFELIEWDAVERAMKALPPSFQRWVTKHTVGMTGVGKFLHRWGFESQSACPRCTTCASEDHLHVVRCEGSGVGELWAARLQMLASWMASNQTAPEILDFVLRLLRTIRRPSLDVSVSQFHSLSPFLFRQALQDQILVGAQGLLEGLLVSSWLPVQRAHQDRLGSSRSVGLWASRLIQQLLAVGRSMWKHRNGVKHSESNRLYDGRHQEVDRGIRDQFRSGFRDAPRLVREMLSRPQARVLELPLEAREAWLRRIVREREVERRSSARQRRMIYALLRRPQSK